MRLIDADALYTDLVKMNDFGELSAKKAIRMVSKAPTVDAVPVEWIERYDEEEWMESGTPHTSVTKLLEVWHERKEE